jgi:hypothetical protein
VWSVGNLTRRRLGKKLPLTRHLPRAVGNRPWFATGDHQPRLSLLPRRINERHAWSVNARLFVMLIVSPEKRAISAQAFHLPDPRRWFQHRRLHH